MHEACRRLCKRRKLDFFIHAKPSDPLDAAHIDFIVCRKRKLIAIQVKGCEMAVEKHVRRWPLIPVLLVEHYLRWKDVNLIAKKVLRIFHTELQSHEHILDTRTVAIIKNCTKEEGAWCHSPFAVVQK